MHARAIRLPNVKSVALRLEPSRAEPRVERALLAKRRKSLVINRIF